MSDPNDPHGPVDPFPTAASPFPPLPEDLPADPPSDWIEQADAHDLPTRENRLEALGRFAFPPAPPLDEEGVAARDRRWTSRAIVACVLFLLVFNARSLTDWARQQPPGWGVSTVEQLGQVWNRQMALLGADRPRETLREAHQAFRDQRFSGAEHP